MKLIIMVLVAFTSFGVAGYMLVMRSVAWPLLSCLWGSAGLLFLFAAAIEVVQRLNDWT
jgi:hypothetical protein